MEVQNFDAVVEHLKKRKKPVSLLMGNGFSMAYDRDIFSYNALYDFMASREDELLKTLFGVIETRNFELVMQQLDTTLALLDAFGSDASLREKIQQASQKLRETLLNSVRELHPEHVFKMPEEKSKACAAFLSQFIESGGQIFTTNYDLLLYWVLMREGVSNPVDGFGKEMENPLEVNEGAEPEWSDLVWGPNQKEQNVHYLHGALHLFDTGADIVKEQYTWDRYLLENIQERLDNEEYPIFVTAGDGDQKLEHIRHNRYLSYCYDQLSQRDGYLVTFGFNFGDYDEHIIEAINRAGNPGSKAPPKLWGVYIGVYSDEDVARITALEKRFVPKVRIFDAKTAKVWGA